jgi:hypothetical protein
MLPAPQEGRTQPLYAGGRLFRKAVQPNQKHMRKFYLLAIAGALTGLVACKKQSEHATTHVTIDTTLAAGASLQLNLQPYGDQDDVASILQQASNATTSEIVNAPNGFAPVYHYVSSANAKSSVSDQVTLAVTEGHSTNRRCGHAGDSTIIVVNFQVK